jgi:1-acyl-sn-glycerol-3-phosphate acyltransferase
MGPPCEIQLNSGRMVNNDKKDELDSPLTLPNLLFSAWVYLVLLACFIANWFLNLLAPSEILRRKITKLSTRIMCSLAGVSITRKIKSTPPTQAIYVANHTSFIDVPVIYSTLPFPFSFVAKRELLRLPLISLFFRRLGTQFIERFNPLEAKRGLREMERVIQAGDSLCFFPEGTFQAKPGVMPFRSGAFHLAERFNLPIVPVSLKGTREVLRAGRWSLRRVPIVITVHPPVEPGPLKGTKEKVRQIIAKGCAERLLE